MISVEDTHHVVGSRQDLGEGALGTPEVVVVLQVGGAAVDVEDGEPQGLEVECCMR